MASKPNRGAAQYLVDPFVPTRDTLPCEHCGTTLSNCDWFPDALGRLSVRCPNAHRHGTGWRAHPEPRPVARSQTGRDVELVCMRCLADFAWAGTGQQPSVCPPCRVDVDREMSRRRQAARREANRAAVERKRHTTVSAAVSERAKTLRAEGVSIPEIARRLNIGKSTVHRHTTLRQNGEELTGLRYMQQLREGA